MRVRGRASTGRSLVLLDFRANHAVGIDFNGCCKLSRAASACGRLATPPAGCVSLKGRPLLPRAARCTAKRLTKGEARASFTSVFFFPPAPMPFSRVPLASELDNRRIAPRGLAERGHRRNRVPDDPFYSAPRGPGSLGNGRGPRNFNVSPRFLSANGAASFLGNSRGRWTSLLAFPLEMKVLVQERFVGSWMDLGVRRSSAGRL